MVQRGRLRMESPVSFRPLLADPPDHEKHPLRFPFLASPKLDGIRCIVTPDGARTRSLKPLPNRELSALLSRPELCGLDGELIAGAATARDAMQATSSAVMSRDASAAGIVFHVFDCLDCFAEPAAPYRLRMLEARRVTARAIAAGLPLQFVEHVRVESFAELMAFESDCIARGFEGAMIRAPGAPYKFGRATAREQYLMKLKRFEDSEGRVLDAFELEHNANEQTRSELGLAKRSTHKAGKVAADTLGGFIVELGAPWAARTLRVGNGWTAEQRAELWALWKRDPDAIRARLLKYKFQREGSKDAPRLPVAIGWRDARDL